jgi:ligand-binding sensor domain-containing protein/DNA-binding CsgD family transcriptional regulator/heme exporter protein D
MTRYLLFTGLWVGLSVMVLAQPTNLGLPSIRNFEKTTYQGGTQSWDFAQDELGRIYVANNEGLLTFDGIHWQRYPLPKQTIVRSLALLPDGLILVGGQSELGYFAGDARGQLRYHSLVEQLPDSLRSFADVWDIDTLDGMAYLRTAHLLMCFDGRHLQVLAHKPKAELLSLSIAAGQIWVHSTDQGFCRWEQGQLRPILDTPAWRERLIVRVLPWQNQEQLLVTLRHGLWLLRDGEVRPWPLSHDTLLKRLRIHAACQLPDHQIALGTALGGVFILDENGRVQQHLDQARGLQDNNVLTILTDRNHNLWLGLNYGIDFLELNSPLSRIYPDGDLRGTAYAAVSYQGRLYLGTSSGLYMVPWQRYYDPTLGTPWRLVAGTQGQVWSLQVVNGQLLMGHHEGAFVIEGNQARHLAGTQGVWTFLSPKDCPDEVIAGTYQGLIRCKNGPQGLQMVAPIEGLKESSRFLVEDAEGYLWMSNPYRGIYRIDLRPEPQRAQWKRYGQADGLPSDIYNHVFSLKGEVIIAGERGIYTYDAAGDSLRPHADYQEIFAPDQRIIRLREDPQGNVWYVAQDEVGVLWIEDQGLRKDIERQVIPSLSDRLVGGFESVYPMDKQHVLFGLEKGFVRYNAEAAAQRDAIWQTLISQIEATTDTMQVLYGGHQRRTQSFRYDPDQNALRFRCGATRYVDPAGLQFRYRLLGLDDSWSAWTELPVKEYTNLSTGKYTFEVQARDGRGGLSAPAELAFEILPAWYQTTGAMLAYGVVCLAIVMTLILVPRHRFEKEKAELEQVHQQQRAQQQQRIAQTQAQVEALEHANLEADIRHKSQELATATMHLVQKNEVIAHLRSELENMLNRHREHPGAKDLRDLVRMLGQDQQFDRDWEQFAYHFDQVHAGFLRRLSERYPQLTPKDQRLCAYLRMNLSTKEIAPLMNISVRGVEISRYRLRKKLDLDREINLNEFMMTF